LNRENRVALTDPLLAAGDMGFSPKGAFMVSGLQEHSNITNADYVTHFGRYAVEALTLPGLEPETVCRYAMDNRTFSAETRSTPEEDGRLEEEDSEEYERKENQTQAAERVCGPKLAPLGFSSLEDVRRNFNFSGRLDYYADHTRRVPPQSPWGCNFPDLSGNLQYELYDCDESRAVVFGNYRAFRVFRLDDGKQIMELSCPTATPGSAISGRFPACWLRAAESPTWFY
jgi:hypothetical protein